MRWVVTDPVDPSTRVGEKKVEEEFLLLPCTLPRADGQKECRWWEIARIEYEWGVDGYRGSDGGGYPTYGWRAMRFVN